MHACILHVLSVRLTRDASKEILDTTVLILPQSGKDYPLPTSNNFCFEVLRHQQNFAKIRSLKYETLQ